MSRRLILLPFVLVVVLLASTIWSQQLEGYILPFEDLGLSDSCFVAINTTLLACPAWLGSYSGVMQASVEILPKEQLELLCGTSCRKDLDNLRNSILGACKGPNDVIVPGGSIAYPATYLVDRFLYATSLSCLEDGSTGQYCDVIAASWNGTSTPARDCSFCELGIQKLQLSSPFGYSEEGAADFSSLTSSCSADGYNYATPTYYALNSTTAPPAPTCTSPYVIKEGDTCVTISRDNNVSTYRLIVENSIDINCNLLPAAGKALCIPRACETHQLQLADTCRTLVRDLNITMAQLLAWNPHINSGCSNLAAYTGWYFCASSPTPTVPVREGGNAITAAPVPPDAQGQSNTNCSRWYLVEEGDYCSMISLRFSISLKDFYFLNPQVDGNCTNLWRNTSYCVQPVGDLATYSGYPVETPSATFTQPPAASFVPSPIEFPPLKPTAPGTIKDCLVYEDAFNEHAGFGNDLETMNRCQNWAWVADVTVDDLIEWNPSLSRESCFLQVEYSYCIRLWERRPVYAGPQDHCMKPNTKLIPPTSLQPSDCDCYVQLRAADKAIFKCSMFSDLFDVDVATVASLNPWIGLDCDTGLWSELSPDGFVQLCVSKNSPPTPAQRSENSPGY
ncbi:hypothetical protein GX50_01673 [[Emmonsia] crescens]|uniref:LysM domain-containing protein n=1 Tax=[Emmonsia] crescens TaxID=73230 RepID=A0A2B7ZQJ2_9EURO|nr:hypothetical protein GX50_01673 [Emmonsia crescens]